MATAAAAGKNNHSCKIIILPMKRADLFERSGKVNKSSNKINSSELDMLACTQVVVVWWVFY